ncbi:FYSH domain-containing protein, partial [Neoconidiobolus thromboides FSU 785]
MSNSAHKVVFKSEHDKDLFVFIADPQIYKKWKSDKSIPLVEVVDSFQIFDTDTGSHTGLASTASKQTISNVLERNNEDDAVRRILEEGELI